MLANMGVEYSKLDQEDERYLTYSKNLKYVVRILDFGKNELIHLEGTKSLDPSLAFPYVLS